MPVFLSPISSSHKFVRCVVSTVAAVALASFSTVALAQDSKPSSSYESPKATTTSATSDSDGILPAAWRGVWRGDVSVDSNKGTRDAFQMELAIGNTAKPDRMQWQITYNGAQGKSVRDYELVATNKEIGHFAIDEKNGIQIDTMLVGNALLSHFSVGGQTIWCKYELTNSVPAEILFELISAPSESAVNTGGSGNIPTVTSLKPSNRQTARLKRSATTAEPSTPHANANDSTALTKWTKLETEAYRGKQDDIYFVNERVGWYANGAGKIFKSIDGGESWTLQHQSPGTYFRCLAFIDEQHGFAGNIGPGYFPNVTDSNPLYETKDGGVTWNAVTTIEGEPIVGLCAMQILREEYVNAGKLDTRIRIIGVGRVGGPTAMIVSDDMGATWQQLDIKSHAAMAFDVFFFSRNVGFIAAASNADVAQSHAIILKTEDGGKTWNRVYESQRPYELTWKIAFPTRDVGYVTIQSYNPDTKSSERFVAKTVDGGSTWSEVALVNNHAVREFGIAFLNEQIGWVGAMPNGFFTNNGGQTWEKAEFGNAVNKIRLIDSPDSTIGFAIGTQVHRLTIPKPSSDAGNAR